MGLWLTPEELVELTGYAQREKQKLALGLAPIEPLTPSQVSH